MLQGKLHINITAWLTDKHTGRSMLQTARGDIAKAQPAAATTDMSR